MVNDMWVDSVNCKAYLYEAWNNSTTSSSVWHDDYNTITTSNVKDYFVRSVIAYENNKYQYWMDYDTNTKSATGRMTLEWATSDWVAYDCRYTLKNPAEKLRDIIRDRQCPYVIGSRKHISPSVDQKELRARDTLQRILGDEKFRRYLRDGFISVRARSGKVYQIFPGHGITRVYENGQMVERLCVVLSGSFPPTDSLIMRYLLILNDERDFRSHAIVHPVIKKSNKSTIIANPETLTDIWNRVRSKTAA